MIIDISDYQASNAPKPDLKAFLASSPLGDDFTLPSRDIDTRADVVFD